MSASHSAQSGISPHATHLSHTTLMSSACSCVAGTFSSISIEPGCCPGGLTAGGFDAIEGAAEKLVHSPGFAGAGFAEVDEEGASIGLDLLLRGSSCSGSGIRFKALEASMILDKCRWTLEGNVTNTCTSDDPISCKSKVRSSALR